MFTDKNSGIHLVMTGAPGTGKGTQASVLKRRFGLCHLSAGEMLREEIEKAYRKNAECYETEKLGSGYIDGYWLYVRFMYDENDCVSQMSISQE